MRRMLLNPFKSAVPLVGDYDINVVIEALKLKECCISLHVVFNARVSELREAPWFELRRAPRCTGRCSMGSDWRENCLITRVGTTQTPHGTPPRYIHMITPSRCEPESMSN